MSAALSSNVSLPKKSFRLRRKEELTGNNDANISRQLRIKTGIVKRLRKDVVSYKEEAEIQQARLDKMLEEKRDEYDIKKMGQVVQESLMMIPHCLRRLKIANEDLKNLTDQHRDIMEDKASHGKGEVSVLYLAAGDQVAEAEALIRNHEEEM